ncbi:hypothetical protein PI95_028690 [Hassallia byssoidea VB512170]|uniref:Uncharacterized protein n=1 Tax=Hassallia byssoidea VB512170 TaxID=1304833 RepID=A0A846HH19_9CYAN|nr:hypothetical protein [Hassalia byssoidea]NEU76383.1 hypothetical protein [Hassalia byssoidea VB512170]
MQQLISLPAFIDYNSVFDEFGFGMRVRCLLLSHIYPLDNFLGSDRKPVIEVITTDKGKTHKRDRSLPAFKLKLGMGLIEDTSGKSQRWIPGGFGHCRQALWQWCLTRIEPKANRRLQTEVGQHLGDYVDKLKIGGTPAKVAQSRCCALAARLLFQKLTRQIT